MNLRPAPGNGRVKAVEFRVFTTGSGKGDKMNTELKEAIEALEKEKNIMR